VQVQEINPAYASVTSIATLTSAGAPQYTTSVSAKVSLQANAAQPADPPLAIIDTTDPTITSASQVSVTVGAQPGLPAPIPLITGITLTELPGGVTQIVVNGVVSAVQPGAGLVAAAPLNITVGDEPPLTAQLEVDETTSAYTVNPVMVNAVAGQPLQNVQVATLAGPATGSYAATIDWGDGDTSAGTITALGGGLYTISGSKPHPYAATGTDTITVTVSGPGPVPAPAAEVTATVTAPAPPPTVQFGQASFVGGENGGSVSIPVTRSGDTSGAASVTVAVTGGSASPGRDLQIANPMVQFATGQTQASVQVTILNDGTLDGNETVNLALTAPSGVALGAQATTVLTINETNLHTSPAEGEAASALSLGLQYAASHYQKYPGSQYAWTAYLDSYNASLWANYAVATHSALAWQYACIYAQLAYTAASQEYALTGDPDAWTEWAWEVTGFLWGLQAYSATLPNG
jgi:hypothetical protein